MQSQLLFTRSTSALLALLALTAPSFAQNPLTSFCSPGVAGVIPCPCSNPPAGLDRGCDNSSATGGASLSASGVAALTGDTLVFTTSGERPTATSIVLQASGSNTSGVAFGQGVRCLSNNLLRLYVKNAVGGSISAPVGTDLSVSARSAALGDTLAAGQTRNYAVYYRDPVVLGGCMSGGTFNMTQSGAVTWIYSSTPPVPALLAINAGTFQMGSSAASGAPYFGDASTQPVHSVTLTYNFWMGATEVTQAQYQALMGTNPSQFVAPNNPVEKVSWNDAQAYCAALTTQQAALGNVPAGYTFRLPTEAEWEYACRAGTTTEFNGGSGLFCSDARFGYSHHSNSSCGSTGPVSVASYFPNNWGLYDMHGNVREWCLDSYVGYSAGAATDPYLTGGFSQVTRGGGWDSNSNLARSAHRAGSSTVGNNLGFRVVLAPTLSPTGTGPTAPAGFVTIQPGTFQMGSNAASGAPYFGDASTQPVHQVTLSYTFWMGEKEVTQAQYQALMGTNPSQFVAPNNPVEKVSWNDAQAYCAALTTQQAALGNVPFGHQYRLPTEAEWEYACRAGTTTEFNTGTALLCNDAKFGYSYHSNSSCNSNNTVAVGSYAPNAWGLYDMHGNVWEWCQDSYSQYFSLSVTDPYVTGSSNRVFRGGSWYDSTNFCRSTYRGLMQAGGATNQLGFRVVLAPTLSPTGTGPTAPAGFVTIQPGTFQMGSNAANGAPYYNEVGYSPQPVHQVTLSYTFWMGEKEVTQAQYQALMGTNPSNFPGANNPVEQVSWNNAVAYCAASTTQQAALGNVPAGYQYRLPTEAEWEYACRAGTTTEFNTGTGLFCSEAKFGYSYHSNSSCNSNNTVAVGSYAPNAWGLYDMHGNVWEWCLDSVANYPSGAVTDPFLTGGPSRVIRGGSWNYYSDYCRSAIRNYYAPGDSDGGIGFRVVLAPVLVP